MPIKFEMSPGMVDELNRIKTEGLAAALRAVKVDFQPRGFRTDSDRYYTAAARPPEQFRNPYVREAMDRAAAKLYRRLRIELEKL